MQPAAKNTKKTNHKTSPGEVDLITNRYFIGLLSAVVVGFFLVNIVWIFPMSQQLQNDVFEKHKTTLLTTKTTVQNYINLHTQYLQSYTTPTASSGSPRMPGFFSISTTTPVSDESFISYTVLSTTTPALEITFSSPPSTVRGTLDLAPLLEEIQQIETTTDLAIILTDTSGAPIYTASTTLVDHLQETSQSEIEGISMIESEDTYALGSTLDQPKWQIFITQPQHTAFATRDKMRQLAVLIGFVALILMITLGWAFKRITEFTRMIEKEREHVAAIIDSITAGIIEYAPDGKITLINPAAQRLLGISREEIEETFISKKWLSDNTKEPLANLFFSKEAQISPQKKHIQQTKLDDPIERDIEVITIPITHDSGSVEAYVKVIHDITEKKFMSKMKTEFISVAAHQLRTPLASIRWSYEMLSENKSLTSKQQSLIEKGQKASENMLDLINDLLDASRIEEGRFGYEFKKHNLEAFIKEVVEDIAIEAEKKDQDIELSLSEPLPKITFDDQKLQLALSNLIENAIKYTPKGGKISVETEMAAPNIKIAVSDNGVGIPEEDKKNLFKKFKRGSNVVQMETAGTGLGLFITKNIILSHGGSIDIESTEGHGTTVTVTLPLSEKEIPEEERSFDEFVEEL